MDLKALMSNDYMRLVAVADVDLTRTSWIKETYPALPPRRAIPVS